MEKIFISYRRDDTSVITSRIYDRIVYVFNKKNVFFDNSDTRDNTDFTKTLITRVSRAKIILIIIGDKWHTILEQLNKIDNVWQRNPDDWVLREIETGLCIEDNEVFVITIDNAKVPHSTLLPITLQQLPQIHQFNIITTSNQYFDSGVNHVIKQIKSKLKRQYSLTQLGIIIVLGLLIFLAGMLLGIHPGDCENICPVSPTQTAIPTMTMTLSPIFTDTVLALTNTELPTVTVSLYPTATDTLLVLTNTPPPMPTAIVTLFTTPEPTMLPTSTPIIQAKVVGQDIHRFWKDAAVINADGNYKSDAPWWSDEARLNWFSSPKVPNDPLPPTGYEAQAFCRWSGHTLLSYAQWQESWGLQQLDYSQGTYEWVSQPDDQTCDMNNGDTGFAIVHIENGELLCQSVIPSRNAAFMDTDYSDPLSFRCIGHD